MLRVLIGEAHRRDRSDTVVSVIEANIDDSSPQVLGYALERLMEAGALDVTLSPLQMKKNRPGTLLRVIAKPEDQERARADHFRRNVHARPAHLLRRAPRAGAQRRRSRDAATAKCAMKVSGDGAFAPEYEDCRALADANRRAAANTIIAAAQLRIPQTIQMKYYLTTPIYYVNAAPHIGHTYTTIAADTIKRFKRMQGYDVVLTTGTDEHGQKVERAAAAAGKTPQEFTDVIAAEFQRAVGEARPRRSTASTAPPTRATHNVRAGSVPALPGERLHLQRQLHRPVLRLRRSSTSTTPSPAIPARIAAAPPKPSPKRITIFKLSAFQEKLLELYEEQPDFIQPETRRNEVLAFVKQGLNGSLHQPHHHQVGHPGSGRSASTSSTSGSTR